MTYKWADGKITVKDEKTGVVVSESIPRLRKIFAETGALPPPFDNRRAMDIVGVVPSGAGEKNCE